MSVIVVLYCILVDLLLLSPSIEPVTPHGDRIGVTMATGIPLQPPESFNFQTPDEWPRWRKHFEQFRIASGLGAKSQEQQVNTLLYCLGKEADDVLTSTGVTVDKRKSYSEVLAKFDGFFTVRKNIIFERAVFNRRQQAEGETPGQYITALYNLASNCNYGKLQNEMI